MSTTGPLCPSWCAHYQAHFHDRFCSGDIRDVLLTVDEPESIADVYLMAVHGEGRATVNLAFGASTPNVLKTPPTARLTLDEARSLALALFAAAEELSDGGA